MSDDITFCMSECDNKECFRHPSNIIDRLIPHSYSDFKGTEACPMNNKKTELEELKEERARINQKIKELENKDIIVVENAKIDKECFPTSRPDEWFVAVKVELVDDGKIIWRSVIRDWDRNKAINKIPFVINGLQNLYDKLMREKDEQ